MRSSTQCQQSSVFSCNFSPCFRLFRSYDPPSGILDSVMFRTDLVATVLVPTVSDKSGFCRFFSSFWYDRIYSLLIIFVSYTFNSPNGSQGKLNSGQRSSYLPVRAPRVQDWYSDVESTDAERNIHSSPFQVRWLSYVQILTGANSIYCGSQIEVSEALNFNWVDNRCV